MTAPILIIGSGLAGYTLARELRKLDKETPLTIITSDDGSFYSKPMLSNALAAGKSAETLVVQPVEKMREQLAATILTGANVSEIDTAGQCVQVNGKWLSYGKLVLALGAEPIRLLLGGNGIAGVFSVNDLGDYARFRKVIEGKKKIAIIGGGLIGCEFANDLRIGNYEVTIVHPAAFPLERMLPPAAGEMLCDKLSEMGVNWRFGLKAEAVDRADDGYCVTLSDGSTLAADAVLSAVGLRPRTALAQAAGIKVNRGIEANAWLETSAQNVYTLGDCAEVSGLVLLYVLPLMGAARALAKTLTGEKTAVSYPPMPVVIKTPACPLVVSVPPMDAAGEWQVARAEEDGVTALFYDSEKALRGYALAGKATEQKNVLAKQLPAML
jgi:rubredoxin-NAD+ reductase